MYPYGYGYYFDPTYILIIIGVIITMIASSKMNSTFRRYSRVRCHCGLTGSQAAERILNQAGIYDVSVERVSGNLTDHYDQMQLMDLIRSQRSVLQPMSVGTLYSISKDMHH